ncbi:MAG: glycosyltransferase [Candidatus Latescibacteria bacterium]|nr:glycosyltransferase [bacterium]MBD3424583.1 glycosyltransferase [Candidatus Latescibacterota bacterium]
MRKSILHIIYSLYRGGAERLIETTVRFSNPAIFKHTVCSLTGEGELGNAIRSAGGTVHTMNKQEKAGPAVILSLARLIRKGHFDLLHLHNTPGNIWGTPAHWMARSRIPIVRTEHGFLFHSRYPAIYKYMYLPFSKRSARIICVCDELRDTLSARFPSIREKFVTIRNGIPIGDFQGLPDIARCRDLFSLPQDSLIIGTVGRLSAEKNQMELIMAFRELSSSERNCYLAIMGEGEMKGHLISTARELGLAESVLFLPETDDIHNFYGALDLFALSSTSEGIPLTILEAMACGLPVVAPAVGGIPEVVEDRLSGLFYPAGRAEILAEKILNILSDPGRGKRMGMRGMKISRQDFSAERFAGDQDRLYLQVMEAENDAPSP